MIEYRQWNQVTGDTAGTRKTVFIIMDNKH